MKKIKVKLFDTLGCTVLSTALFQSLRREFPDSEIVAYSEFPDLLAGFQEIDDIIDSNDNSSEEYDIDLRGYLSDRPHNHEPFKHLYIHMINHAERQLVDGLSGELRRDFLPKINLQDHEMSRAREIVKSVSREKPAIWIQPGTGSPNKDWPREYWEKLIEEKPEYEFIDLSSGDYEPRTAIAMAESCDAGIALDSFLLHGSKSVDAKNVIAILGSSRPETVTYPGNIVIYKDSGCEAQPCGMHGYGIGCEQKYEHLFVGHEKARCIMNDYKCMRLITPGEVIRVLDKILIQK